MSDAYRFFCFSSISFHLSYSYVRQIKLATGQLSGQLWAHDIIVIDCLAPHSLSYIFGSHGFVKPYRQLHFQQNTTLLLHMTSHSGQVLLVVSADYIIQVLQFLLERSQLFNCFWQSDRSDKNCHHNRVTNSAVSYRFFTDIISADCQLYTIASPMASSILELQTGTLKTQAHPSLVIDNQSRALTSNDNDKKNLQSAIAKKFRGAWWQERYTWCSEKAELFSAAF